MPTLTFPGFVGDDAEIPDFTRPLIDPSYDVSKVGKGLLRDGSVQSYVLQQFRDVDGGIEASLHIWYPAACPDSVVEEHLQDYAVEFRNGCRMVAAAPCERKRDPASGRRSAPGRFPRRFPIRCSRGYAPGTPFFFTAFPGRIGVVR